jgi:Domain of unknown function (DUF1992)
MEEHDPLRRAARYRVDHLEHDEGTRDVDATTVGPSGDGAEDPQPRPAAPKPATMAARGAFADELVRQAMARGDFDDLPLTGKPIPGLTGRHDPDWWLKAFIEREQITGVLPEALQLRKDDADLDDRLDRQHLEDGVREVVEEFNARIVEARRQLLGGPPVITPLRDVEREVARWRERRRAGQAQVAADDAAAADRAAGRPPRRAWWRRAGAAGTGRSEG